MAAASLLSDAQVRATLIQYDLEPDLDSDTWAIVHNVSELPQIYDNPANSVDEDDDLNNVLLGWQFEQYRFHGGEIEGNSPPKEIQFASSDRLRKMWEEPEPNSKPAKKAPVCKKYRRLSETSNAFRARKALNTPRRS